METIGFRIGRLEKIKGWFMATGRMLQKRISNSRKMALLSSDGARLLYTWMLSHLDSNGCFFADPVMVNNIVFTRLGKTAKEVQKYLDELSELNCIIRYEIEGESYLIYPDFLDKQVGLRPDREGKSDIPKPTPEILRSKSGLAPQEGEEKEKRKEGEENTVLPPDSSGGKDCPHSKIVDLYHTMLPTLPKVREWTPARQSTLRSRWNEKKERQSLDWWVSFFTLVANSDFLCGRITSRSGEAPFQANLEWLLQPRNFVKVLEGNYANRKPTFNDQTKPLSESDRKRMREE